MKKVLFLVFALGISLFQLKSQDLSYGFRAGINLSTLNGPLVDGESYDYNTGFHIGIGFGTWFTDIWGARAEIIYNQKGVQSAYEGPSNILLPEDEGGAYFLFSGTRKMSVNASTSYIDVPISVFARVTNWLELSAGVVPGFLVYGTATGELQFSSSSLTPFSQELDFSYYGDAAGEGDYGETLNLQNFDNGDPFILPSVAGAYFYQEKKDGNYYRVFDLGLLGGVSFYLNRGLYLGARVQYGLFDVTNEKADFSFTELDGNSPKPRNDKDSNLGYQFCVGFNF